MTASSLYDRLVVDVSVSVVTEGSFCVVGELHGDDWNVTATSYVNSSSTTPSPAGATRSHRMSP